MNPIPREFVKPRWGLNKWKKNGRKPLDPEKTYIQFFEYRPLKLRNFVAGKGSGVKETQCVPQILRLLECLKDNDYMQTQCSQEIATLTACYSAVQEKAKAAAQSKDQSEPIPYQRNLTAAQVNTLLRRFPQKFETKK